MTSWRVNLKEEAIRDIKFLDKAVQESVIAKLDWFIGSFGDAPTIPLRHHLSEFYKLRVGDGACFTKLIILSFQSMFTMSGTEVRFTNT